MLDTQRTELRRLLVRALLGVLVLVGVMAGLSALVAEPVERLTAWIVGILGLPGLAAGLILGESTPLPIPGDAWLVAVAAGDAPVIVVGLTLGVSSVAAGSLGYLLGPVLARLPYLRKRVEAHRARGEAFFSQFGMWTVAIGSITPLPYALLCWTAGVCRMSYKRFLAATLLRVPRYLGYLLLFRLGWESVVG